MVGANISSPMALAYPCCQYRTDHAFTSKAFANLGIEGTASR